VCVSEGRSALFSRAAFFGVAAAVAAPLALGAESIAEAADPRYPLPMPAGILAPGNAHAMRLAERSPYVRALYSNVEALARTITTTDLRESVLRFLQQPTPDYAANQKTPHQREAVRDALATAGFVKPDAPLVGIFPVGTEAASSTVMQPFWSTAGSGEGSHHAYPGGLATHEYFNASMADGFAKTYDAHYFGGRPTVDRDTIIAAALYHDIMKTAVFQWHEDGTLFDELEIAGTGGHHCLSGAQAIVHGRTPRFVTTLLSAHAAPSLGDEKQVVNWCHAAAMIAGVDPVDYGLLKPDGSGFKLAADPVPVESFINYLSDHDYVLSVHAAHVVNEQLKSRYAQWQPPATLPWYRAAVLSQSTAIALYDTLARRGQAAFTVSLQQIESHLSFT
jgi:hypothetical protein